MMRFALLLCLLVGTTLGAGCAQVRMPVVPPQGLIYTNVKAPATIDTQLNVDRSELTVGTGEAHYLLEFLITRIGFAWGETSISSVARGAGIDTVHYADYEVMSILGIYQKFTLNVYGES